MLGQAGATFKRWTQGLRASDVPWNAAGLAATVYGPSAIFKNPEQKLARVLTSFAIAIAMGAFTEQFASPRAAQATVFGAVSGSIVQVYVNYGQAVIKRSQPKLLTAGSAETIRPAASRETETITLVRP